MILVCLNFGTFHFVRDPREHACMRPNVPGSVWVGAKRGSKTEEQVHDVRVSRLRRREPRGHDETGNVTWKRVAANVQLLAFGMPVFT